MAVTTTSVLSNSVQAKYQAEFILAQKETLYYDQLSYTVEQANMLQGSSIKVPFYFDLPPNVTAVSQTADINPETMADALFTVTPDLYGSAVQLPEKLRRTAFTNVVSAAGKIVGRQAGMSVDFLARTAATQGTWVLYGGSATARTNVDRVNDQLAYADFITAGSFLADNGAEPISNGKFLTVLGHTVMKDILEDSVIQAIGSYQKGEILLQGEIGTIGGIKIVTTHWAKRFYGVGTSASSISTTLSSAKAAGATTISLASDTSVAVGQWLTISSGAADFETSTTEYPQNELVYVASGSASPWTIIGSGANGGLRYAHISGAGVKDNDTVHAVCFYGKNGIGKVYSPDTGAMGKVLPPKTTGLLDQFQAFPWKWFGGYGRPAENRLLRYEVATSKGN